MVSSPHEALHRIFQEDTSLFTRTFQRLLGVNLPEPRSVSVLNSDATEIRPMERRMDTVLLAEGEVDNQILLVEPQTDQDQEKRRRWPYYVAFLNDKYRCDVTLLVICSKSNTAKWARRHIEIGLTDHPCMVVRPFVLGPDNVPAVTDLTEATDDVVFAVFSALTHARSPQSAAILEVLAAALDTIDTESAGFFAEFTEVGLGKLPGRNVWRNLMKTQRYRYQSEFACELRAEGEAKGKAEGRAEGEAVAVLRILDKRGVHVPGSVRDQILSCTDIAVLDGWLDRAISVSSVEDLFD